MYRKISEVLEVKAPISKAWEVYSTFKLADIINSELAQFFRVEILEGDGGTGSVIKITPNPGVSSITPYKEKFINIDNEKRVKEVEIIEGGYLELGFTFYRIKLEFLELEIKDSCIIRITAEYEANEDVILKADPSIVTIKPVIMAFEIVNQYIENNKNSV